MQKRLASRRARVGALLPRIIAVTALLPVFAGACQEGGDRESRMVRQGRVAYETACTACHARDPGQKGVLGPALAGASLELLEAKVLRGAYPAGYTPKQPTQIMVALPHVQPELPAIHAYLASAVEADAPGPTGEAAGDGLDRRGDAAGGPPEAPGAGGRPEAP